MALVARRSWALSGSTCRRPDRRPRPGHHRHRRARRRRRRAPGRPASSVRACGQIARRDRGRGRRPDARRRVESPSSAQGQAGVHERAVADPQDRPVRKQCGCHRALRRPSIGLGRLPTRPCSDRSGSRHRPPSWFRLGHRCPADDEDRLVQERPWSATRGGWRRRSAPVSSPPILGAPGKRRGAVRQRGSGRRAPGRGVARRRLVAARRRAGTPRGSTPRRRRPRRRSPSSTRRRRRMASRPAPPRRRRTRPPRRRRPRCTRPRRHRRRP